MGTNRYKVLEENKWKVKIAGFNHVPSDAKLVPGEKIKVKQIMHLKGGVIYTFVEKELKCMGRQEVTEDEIR